MVYNNNQPVLSHQRMVNLDIIRGIALLGILIMNIQAFSMVSSAYSNPTTYGDLTGVNYYVYYFSHIFADQKFMTIFSVLFGVGIILMSNNIEKKGGCPGKVHYTRMFILAVFGLLHIFLLWFGDILFAYALAGMIVYLARQKSPKFLFITGFILIAICSLLMWVGGLTLPYWEEAELKTMQEIWAPSVDIINDEVRVNQASWLGQTEQRNLMASKMLSNILFYLSRIVGLMMIGMALFKINFFGERFKSKILFITGVAALIVGLAIIIYGNRVNFAKGWPIESMLIGVQYNYWGSILVAYSYLCFILIVCRLNLLVTVKKLLANVGRMALTNYLSHTLICGFIFYGWGLGNFGSFERYQQMFVVLGIWLFQLVFSSYWISRYQFGPFEWLWRSLTYLKVQPLRKVS